MINTNEITETTAGVIQDLHNKACASAHDCKGKAEDALHYAQQCGAYLSGVKQMTKGRLLGWLKDNVPDLTPDRAAAYMGLYHTQTKRVSKDLDKQQLLLLGVLDKRIIEKQTGGISQGDDKWFVHVNKVRGWFNSTIRERPVEKWTEEEQSIAANQLLPLVEIYNKLTKKN